MIARFFCWLKFVQKCECLLYVLLWSDKQDESLATKSGKYNFDETKIVSALFYEKVRGFRRFSQANLKNSTKSHNH